MEPAHPAVRQDRTPTQGPAANTQATPEGHHSLGGGVRDFEKHPGLKI